MLKEMCLAWADRVEKTYHKTHAEFIEHVTTNALYAMEWAGKDMMAAQYAYKNAVNLRNAVEAVEEEGVRFQIESAAKWLRDSILRNHSFVANCTCPMTNIARQQEAVAQCDFVLFLEEVIRKDEDAKRTAKAA